ncbi:MAG TPA: glycoside hydrolase family 3 N-terminal domain-containing protein [Jatrophihabitantaceae bacterium]|nr:glycoside hydrolase family 3 N-terminal domain-containing protein [Jatrophihabitantaceae bacterium]
MSARVERLIAQLSLEEKLAQLVGLWVSVSSTDGEVAPLQDESLGEVPDFEVFAKHGLGQLTRVFGGGAVEPAEGLATLRRAQTWLRENTRPGIGALVHEECLTGLMAWRATAFPTPLAWGASWDPTLVERVAAAIGTSMRALGVHQGLAPVLDVVRDMRWGRVEECIGEDPYLIGEIGAGYVRGLQSRGVVATLKHFAGYSASAAGRNHAPAHLGRRELTDVFLVPFEIAVRDAGAESVMHSYAEVDGVPAASDAWLLDEVLREQWGFTGTVVSDYFGIAFLQAMHGVAADLGQAAELALAAGVDVELPTGRAFGEPLADRVRSGAVPMALVDRALRRVLVQKERLGLLDGEPDAAAAPDLDPPEHRQLARELAEESVVLLENDGTLPLAAPPPRIAVVGPTADDPRALLGNYSFASHVLGEDATDLGIDVASVLDALRAEFAAPAAGAVPTITHAAGCTVSGDERSGLPAAVDAARDADVCVLVVGDRAGLFGRGTVGEGSDASDLQLPGLQRELAEAVLDTGTPTVLVALTGRAYALDWASGRAAAVVQAFFPGEEGAAAVAGVLSGRVNPSGRLPVSMPRSAGTQPYSYLHPRLGAPSQVSTVDTSPAHAFGHGLSYTTFERNLELDEAHAPTDGAIGVTCTVRNTGTVPGTDVVQLYAHDPVASVTRPVAQLVGFGRVHLEPGGAARVHFIVPTARVACTDRSGRRVVEPGALELWVGTSQRGTRHPLELTGPVHVLTGSEPRLTRVDVQALDEA